MINTSSTSYAPWDYLKQGDTDAFDAYAKEHSIDPNWAPTDGDDEGKTVGWLITQRTIDFLRDWKFEPNDINVNAAPKRGPDAGVTVAWNLVKGKSGDRISDFEEFFFEIENIDCAPREGDFKGKSIAWLVLEEDFTRSDFKHQAKSFLKDFHPDLTLKAVPEGDLEEISLFDYLIKKGVSREYLLAQGGGDLYPFLNSLEARIVRAEMALHIRNWSQVYFGIARELLPRFPSSEHRLADDYKKFFETAFEKVSARPVLRKLCTDSGYDPVKVAERRSCRDEHLSISAQHKVLSDKRFIPALFRVKGGSLWLLEEDASEFNRLRSTVMRQFSLLSELLGPRNKAFRFSRLSRDVQNMISMYVAVDNYPWLTRLTFHKIKGFFNNLPLSRDHALDLLTEKSFTVWRFYEVGIEKDAKSDITKEDLRKLWEDAINDVEKYYPEELVLNPINIDQVVEEFKELSSPLTARKLEPLLLGTLVLSRHDAQILDVRTLER